MLSRKLFFPACTATSTQTLLRAFTTASCKQKEFLRSPSLGDVTHDGAEAFNARQREFRDGLEVAKKKKEQADSQFLTAPNASSTSYPSSPDIVSTAHSTGNTSSTSSKTSAVLETLGLGSLSTPADTGEARQAEHDTTTKRKGPFSNLIYGTAEGQQMDKDMERSFSQVLARGKYVHSIVFHDVIPDKVDEYVDLVGKWYPKIAGMPENKVNLVGSWRTEVGDVDTFGLPPFSEMTNLY
jgi:hypothetical protein